MSLAFSWKVLEVGKTRRDGGAFFGEVPRPEWLQFVTYGDKGAKKVSQDAHVSRQNEISLSCNVLLLQTDEDNILVDTGPPLGNSLDLDIESGPSKLRKALKEHKLFVKDITKVIVTSTDYDHMGGLFSYDRAGNLGLALPNAQVFAFCGGHNRARPSLIPHEEDSFPLLEEKDKLQWVLPTDNYEVVPGVFMRYAPGPSRGSAVVEVRRGADRMLYLSDLCPTATHLNPAVIAAYDDAPDDTYLSKIHWLKQAEKEGAVVIFPHGNDVKAGYLETTKEGRRLRPA
jgi:glyoxylase-like metal-dependent hydrolase (beta-lactamase superfamily II)